MKKRCLGCMEEYDTALDTCPCCGYVYGSPPKEVYHISPGAVLANRYVVGRVLGSGGFGITYIGYDKLLQQVVAIKEYFLTEFATRMPNQTQISIYGGDPEEQFKAGMKKTLEEARRLAQFQNEPDILQIYDFFEENNTAYIVMEYLEGETLKEKLQREKRMTVEDSLPIILSVLGALKKVHRVGIIHRDIAPDNIFLLKNGVVKLIDFGASRYTATTHTKSLTVLLKFGYAPLEQYLTGGNQGPWTDIYALAATFYRMLTGKNPPEATERKRKDTIEEPSKLGVNINKNTENALMNALQVKIADRTKSAREFEEALLASEVVRTEATLDEKLSLTWPVWLKAAAAGASALVLIFVIALAVGVIDYKPHTAGSMELAADETRIPNLINMEQDEARRIVEEYGLEFVVGDSETSEKIKEGRVLGQKIGGEKVNAGMTVKKGAVLSVTISSGKGTAQIPDIRWITKERAAEELKSSRLIVVNYEEDTDTFAAPGIVTGVEPEVGSNVELKQNITLKIASGGKEKPDKSLAASVPDLSQKTQEEAARILAEEGLYMEKSEISFHDMVEKGCIISQSPLSGKEAHQGDTIIVAVSAGKEMIEVPYLQNEAGERAVETLTKAGLVSEEKHLNDNGVEAGFVIRQDIEPGEMVEKGTVVTFYVSDGPEPQSTQESTSHKPTRTKDNTTQPHSVETQQAAPPQPVTTQAPIQAPTQAPTEPPTTADPIWEVVGE